ncbi:UNVERIFIED_CONTAM: hypothetical protein Sradi_5818500 [Sesamum radiatum]|uniref:RNase H type-1 domain-containing protein n=1 Tax=Sesamum radiatum TaxID=300843 RepID=A0AAW2KP79_SESRA
MLFDGVARSDGAGAGVVFVSAEKQILTYSIVLSELCSNNITDYQALIIDLQMALEMGIMEMEVYGDSKLIINQLLDIYEVKKDDLVLPSLDTSYHENSNAITIATNDEEDWRTPRMEYLKHGKLPNDSRHKIEVRRRLSRFILYRRSFEGTYKRCLSGEKVRHDSDPAHPGGELTNSLKGFRSAHQSGLKLHFRIKKMGYYWPTMVKDCLEYAKKCKYCNYTPTSFTNHWNLYILQSFHGGLMHRDLM